jgi:D-alanine-D-alanine ligase-like ATP-grasp enzyme
MLSANASNTMAKAPAFLFIEKGCANHISNLARVNRERGVKNIYVCAPKTELTEPALFDWVIENEAWDIDSLKRIRDELAAQYDLRAMVWFHGLFGKDGLHGYNVATLAEEIGVPSQGRDAIYRCNNKYLTRDALRAAGVATVDFGMAVDEASSKEHAARIGYPVILKPVTGAASSLILKCRNEAELLSNFRLAMERLPLSFYSFLYICPHTYKDKSGRDVSFNPMRSMLMEKYIPGREASVECVVTADGEVHPLVVHDKVKITEEAKVFYEHLLVTPCVRFTPAEVEEMKEYARRAVKAVGLRNTLTHVELRYNDATGPQILEINPRVGGMYIGDSLTTMVGLDPVRAQVDLAQGAFKLKRAIKPAAEYETQIHGMFAIYPPHGGTLESLTGLEELQKLPGVIKAELKYPVGTKISGNDEECFLVTCFMRGESYNHIIDTYEKACQLIKLTVNA